MKITEESRLLRKENKRLREENIHRREILKKEKARADAIRKTIAHCFQGFK